MLLEAGLRRPCKHGTGYHSAGDSAQVRPPRSAAGHIAETGRTGAGLALRWRRHHLLWGSVGVEEAGRTDRDRAAVRRLLRGLPPPGPDRSASANCGRSAVSLRPILEL